MLLFVSVQTLFNLSLHIALLSLFGIFLKFTPNFYTGSLFCLHYPLSFLLLMSFLHLTSACWGTYLLTLDIKHLVFCNINSSFYQQTSICHHMLSLWLFKKIRETCESVLRGRVRSRGQGKETDLNSSKISEFKSLLWDFPGAPMVKIHLSRLEVQD